MCGWWWGGGVCSCLALRGVADGLVPQGAGPTLKSSAINSVIYYLLYLGVFGKRGWSWGVGVCVGLIWRWPYSSASLYLVFIYFSFLIPEALCAAFKYLKNAIIIRNKRLTNSWTQHLPFLTLS